jgi:hypothetical protein
MGRDFKYIIFNKEQDEYPSYRERWTELMVGMTIDGRDKWGGPYSDDCSFTRTEMKEALEEYIKEDPYDTYEFAFTMKAFGEIISDMEDDNVVYICYD